MHLQFNSIIIVRFLAIFKIFIFIRYDITVKIYVQPNVGDTLTRCRSSIRVPNAKMCMTNALHGTIFPVSNIRTL